MLRGLAGGMGVRDFSAMEQWAPYARAALAGGVKARDGPCVTAPTDEWDALMKGGLKTVEDVAVVEGGGDGVGGDVDSDADSTRDFVTTRAVAGLGLVPLDDHPANDKDEARSGAPLH